MYERKDTFDIGCCCRAQPVFRSGGPFPEDGLRFAGIGVTGNICREPAATASHGASHRDGGGKNSTVPGTMAVLVYI